ncbi:MAG: pilus assembly protein [Deltaproteobacteria bacterium]|nr:pilus assembly protein [Deltaproteobacteria bacterium]
MNIYSDTRGVAMTEGVIVIPFFIIVWLGIFSVYAYYVARLEAQANAASGAYSQAIGGNCDDVTYYSGPVDSDDDKNSESQEKREPLESGISRVESDAAFKELRKVEGSGIWDNAKDINPLAHQFVESKADVVHEIYGRRTERAHGERYMLCNSKPVNGILDFIGESLKSMVGIND